jgi:prevent-host-death family protein
VVTASEFHRKPVEIRALSDRESVFVTHRGRVTTVILSIAEYERLRGRLKATSLFDVLAAGDDEADLEIVGDAPSDA